MSVQKINEFLYLTDLKPAGFAGFIASYTLLGDKVGIVETGPTSTVNNLLKGLDEIGVKYSDVSFIAISHIHLDHGGGAGTLVKYLPNAKLIVHPRGAANLVNPEKLWQQSRQVLGTVAEMYEAPEPVPPERILPTSDGMTIDLGRGVKLEAMETLGHASHHYSYFETKDRILFPGDAAGIYLNQFDVIVPTTPPPFHLETALASIKKLERKTPSLLCYTHFGVATDAKEKLERHAAQLRLWAKIVGDSLRKGETMDVMIDAIRRGDPAINSVHDYMTTHPVLGRSMIKQNAQGFVGYLQKPTN